MENRLRELDACEFGPCVVPGVQKLQATGLGVGVNQENLVAFGCGHNGQVDGQGRLPYPSFGVGDGVDVRHGYKTIRKYVNTYCFIFWLRRCQGRS